LKVTQFNKVQDNTNYFQNAAAPKQAVFDSTTSKILIDSTTLTSVINGITGLGATVDQTKCQLIRRENYQLNFQFQLSEQDKTVQSKINANQFRVQLNDLLLEQEDKSCILLLQATTAATDPWVLGTTFLQNVYAYFNYDSHNV
jgi:Eukaryotic aspartyl protease